jgi:hypothetical protein
MSAKTKTLWRLNLKAASNGHWRDRWDGSRKAALKSAAKAVVLGKERGWFGPGTVLVIEEHRVLKGGWKGVLIANLNGKLGTMIEATGRREEVPVDAGDRTPDTTPIDVFPGQAWADPAGNVHVVWAADLHTVHCVSGMHLKHGIDPTDWAFPREILLRRFRRVPDRDVSPPPGDPRLGSRRAPPPPPPPSPRPADTIKLINGAVVDRDRYDSVLKMARLARDQAGLPEGLVALDKGRERAAGLGVGPLDVPADLRRILFPDWTPPPAPPWTPPLSYRPVPPRPPPAAPRAPAPPPSPSPPTADVWRWFNPFRR